MLMDFVVWSSTRASQEAEVLRVPLSRDLSPVRGTLEPYAEEMKTKIQQRSSSNRSCRARWGPEELKQRVDQRLQEFQDTVVPMADQVQVEMAQRALMVRQAVAPYAEDLKGKLDPYAQDLQAQLTSLYQSFVNVNNSFINRHWECITNIRVQVIF
ncbi:unnamed protein product [Arctogadus glacialis]